MAENYDDFTVDELRAKAAERDISGRSSMNREELIDALESDDAETGNADTGENAIDAEAASNEVPAETGAVHESHSTGGAFGGGRTVFDGVEEGEAERAETDADLGASVVRPGAPGPNEPRSRPYRADATMTGTGKPS